MPRSEWSKPFYSFDLLQITWTEAWRPSYQVIRGNLQADPSLWQKDSIKLAMQYPLAREGPRPPRVFPVSAHTKFVGGRVVQTIPTGDEWTWGAARSLFFAGTPISNFNPEASSHELRIPDTHSSSPRLKPTEAPTLLSGALTALSLRPEIG
ncbi:hypothetical protein Bbelb_194450 [Branchiostoma belcheri]|nr:hypothetical protein Bbelb_194450 [Branchiostoma belcheri]